ncbi:MAG: TIGR04283 family arsenosugar biosynthesis glycosyltransferase [Burkholderiales bacterium]|nr:TIGR04283 family arsenosugar biosynthesis glycosyltransferase [Burkholderiales bacterium]
MTPLAAAPDSGRAPALSIVVPVLDEAAALPAALGALQPLRACGVELVVVDGGSTDGTPALAAPFADQVIAAPRGRARQMNAGAAVARAPRLLFLHADTRLPAAADALVLRALQGRAWGRFDVRIDGRSRWLPLVAALMSLRSRLTGIATGDQAVFVRRDTFDRIGGFPDQPLMEDVEISRRLRAIGWPACLRARVVTSGRRWDAHGAWRTIRLMWRLRWRYWRGESPQSLAEAYRR